MSVYFYEFERDEKIFASLDELKEQINLDKSNAKKYFR
ncbi:MAG: riboflavin kinase [Candidatus Onthovivens sp.]